MPNEPVLLRSGQDGIVTLTLNRPAQYNALSVALMAALQEELDQIGGDPEVRVVVIEGAGRGFCAGHDLAEVRASGGRSFFEALFQQCSDLMISLTRLPQPVIAKVHGVATAAGCQLVATCDLAVAAETARFGTPGVNIGLFCSTPMVALSRAVPRKTALRMLMTGELVDAQSALGHGLVSHVVAEEALDQQTAALAATVASKSPLTLKIGKEAFYRQIELDLAAAYAYTAEVMTTNMLARDAEEGIDAFLEKREPRWEGR